MSQKFNPKVRATGLALAAGFFAPAGFTRPPEAGTTIPSTASVNYLNTRLGISETLRSVTVEAEIGGMQSISIASDQRLLRAPGDNAKFSFQITNTGNIDAEIVAGFSEIGGDFNLSRVIVWRDTNLNGRIDGQDVRLAPDEVISIPYAKQVGVLIESIVPSAALEGMTALGELGVVLQGSGGQAVSARAEVVVTAAVASLVKSADYVDGPDGGEIIYALGLRNNSNSDIQPGPVFDGAFVSVDGVEQNLLIVRDEIPLNTNFKRIVDAVNFDPVFHRRGDPDHEWLSQTPEDLTLIDAVAFVSAAALPPQSARDLSFAVDVSAHADGIVIENVADFLLPDGANSAVLTASNLVATPVAGEGGEIVFYANPGFDDPAEAAGFDELMFVEVFSGACNVTAGIDEAILTLRTEPDGDEERFTLVETAANSGVFRVGDIRVGPADPVLINDGILQGARRSMAVASVDCDPSVSAELAISPAGAVFLSATNEAVPGARVELLDATGNVLVETLTDADGLYEIAPEFFGLHSLRVTPPESFVAPSRRTRFDGFGRAIAFNASFGRAFPVLAPGRALSIDIPVDPDLQGALIVSKAGDRSEAGIGDVIQYTVEVQNTSPIAVQQGQITDVLPRGLELVEGSVLLDGGPLADPALNTAGDLIFDIGLLSPNQLFSLTYSVRVLPNAGEGDKINLAFAEGELVGFDERLVSNTASFTVDVDNSDGVFSRDGVILGKVFLDCNANGLQDGAHEPGIPGVQIYTQEGLFVVTDHAGRYSLSQLSPRTHVLDVRDATLPAGTSITATRVFDAGRGGSRFVPLRAGEIRSEDFAAAGCADETLESIRARMAELQSHVDLMLDGSAGGGQLQFERAETGQQTEHVSTAKTIVSRREDDPVLAAPAPEAGRIGGKGRVPSLPAIVGAAGTKLSFVDLQDGEQLIRRSTSVRVTASAGLEVELSLNGSVIGADRIGQRIVDGEHQGIEYVSVPLVAGENRFVLTGRDGFGNVRETETVSIVAPGEAARVQILAPATAIADAARPVPIRLQVVDADGRPTAALVEATLDAHEDAFDVSDTSEQMPGLQTLLEDGAAEIDLIPSELVGTHTISVETAFGRSEARIRFTPALDNDQIAVGIAEGAVGISGNGVGALAGLFDRDEISPFEDTEDGVEGAFFLKGRIFKDFLLTLRHDSSRDVDSDLFRSVEPDDFYPVYGDQSERGFDARSRGKTFGKVEFDSSYVLFGDVAFDAASRAFQLGTFQRTLEGARAHVETGRLSVDVYAGQTDTGQQIVEIPALGISGPYPLNFQNVVENSETVELITRDRNQPDVIIRTERLGRFSAYTLDFFSRSLVFNRPIASRDADLNPVSIRVTFETETGDGEDYWLFGGEGAFSVTDWLSVGYRQLTSDGPAGSEDDRTVRASYVAADIGEGGRLEIEAAQSIDPMDRDGLGLRLNYEQETKRGTFGARVATTSEDFDAPGAAVNAGRDEARLYGNQRIGPGTLTAEALYSAEQASDAERYGAVARFEATLTPELRARLGSRYVNDTNATGRREDALTIIVGLGWSPKSLGSVSVDLEAEQEVTDGTQSRVSVGADYALSPKTRLYAQADYTGSRSGSFGLADGFNDDVTVRLGGEYRWSDRVTAFSEYRADQGFFDSGVANGLTAGWTVSPNLSLRSRIEHVQPIGETFRRNTALGVGSTWEPENRRSILDGDFEYAAGQDGQRSWYLSASAGQRWKDITFLARNRYAQTVAAGQRRERDRLRAGAAYRPQNNSRLNALAWYEYEIDDQDAFEEQRHIWSVGGEWQPGRYIRWRGRFAGQTYALDNAVIAEDSTTLLLQGGGDLDVHERINLAVNANIVGDTARDNASWALGGEMNFRLVDNFLLGVGYSHSDLTERRFERLVRTGFHVRLRIKFDESVWNIFDQTN